MKKIISVILSILMISLLPTAAWADTANAAVAKDSVGDSTIQLEASFSATTLDFYISDGITVTNSGNDPSVLTYSDLKISNNMGTGALQVDRISAAGENGYKISADSGTEWTKLSVKDKKLSMLISCGSEVASHDMSAPLTQRLVIDNGNSVTYSFSGHTGITDTAVTGTIAQLVVTVSLKAAETPAALKLTGKNLEVSVSEEMFERMSDGDISEDEGYLEYSTDGKRWVNYISSNSLEQVNGSYIPRMKPSYGNTLYIRGKNISYFNDSYTNNAAFEISGSDVHISGNIEALRDYETVEQGSLPAVKDYAFYNLFKGNDAIVDASGLELSRDDLSNTVTYYSGMFSGCTNLTAAPELPATTLGFECYAFMFAHCTALETPPALRAMNLARSCYSDMFHDCTSLSALPALPATTLYEYCYNGMFYGCTNIKISENSDDIYVNEFRIPKEGAAIPSDSIVYLAEGEYTGTEDQREDFGTAVASGIFGGGVEFSGELMATSAGNIYVDKTYYTPNTIIY